MEKLGFRFWLFPDVEAVAEAESLREELRDFRRHVTAAGNTRFEGRIGRHDNLVLARRSLCGGCGGNRVWPDNSGLRGSRARLLPSVAA